MPRFDVDELLVEQLVDPVDKTSLSRHGNSLVSASGRTYQIVEEIPVLLVRDAVQTTPTAQATLDAIASHDNDDTMYLRTTGIGALYMAKCREAYVSEMLNEGVDPAISYLVMRGGHMYHHLLGKLDDYPIPEMRLPLIRDRSAPPTLLDVGSNWGRWSIAAAKKGYQVVALDPSLGALMAGRRAARKMGITINWVVGDARYLPFRDAVFDHVFSYGVAQHFSSFDLEITLREIRRVMSPTGASLIQMANGAGLRSYYHQLRRRFREPAGMDVRYHSISHLKVLFNATIGPSKISVDGFFGLGIQDADLRFMTLDKKFIIIASSAMRALSQYVPFLVQLADSVYVSSSKFDLSQNFETSRGRQGNAEPGATASLRSRPEDATRW